jgi:hypothetical protein
MECAANEVRLLFRYTGCVGYRDYATDGRSLFGNLRYAVPLKRSAGKILIAFKNIGLGLSVADRLCHRCGLLHWGDQRTFSVLGMGHRTLYRGIPVL